MRLFPQIAGIQKGIFCYIAPVLASAKRTKCREILGRAKNLKSIFLGGISNLRAARVAGSSIGDQVVIFFLITSSPIKFFEYQKTTRATL
jgi:hypothetical protein